VYVLFNYNVFHVLNVIYANMLVHVYIRSSLNTIVNKYKPYNKDNVMIRYIFYLCQ